MMGKRKGHPVAPLLLAIAGRIPSWSCKSCGGGIRWLSPRSPLAVHA